MEMLCEQVSLICDDGIFKRSCPLKLAPKIVLKVRVKL